MRPELFHLHADLEERHWWFRARRTIMLGVIRAAVPRTSGATAIDVGCGTGANIAALASDYRCVGLDPSGHAIALARQRYPLVHFINGVAVRDIAHEAPKASLFLMMDVLEHVPDDFLLLSSLLAASSHGAHLLITVPADKALWSQHDVSFAHYRRYDPTRLSAIWEGLPVSVRLLSYYNARLYPLVKMARMASRLRGSASGIAATDLQLPPAIANAALERIFAGESHRLVGALDSGEFAYRRGVSLIALLRREPGRVEPRTRPADIPPDQHDPGVSG